MWVLNFVNLSSGASMLLYDGSPFYPTPTVLLQLAQETGLAIPGLSTSVPSLPSLADLLLRVSIFGTSPRYLEELRSRNIVPRKMRRLSCPVMCDEITEKGKKENNSTSADSASSLPPALPSPQTCTPGSTTLPSRHVLNSYP